MTTIDTQLVIREEETFTRYIVFVLNPDTDLYDAVLVDDYRDSDDLVEEVLDELSGVNFSMLPWVASIALARRETYDREPVQ